MGFSGKVIPRFSDLCPMGDCFRETANGMVQKCVTGVSVNVVHHSEANRR